MRFFDLFKDKTGNGSQSRLPFFRPRPSLIPLFRGRKDKKVGEIWYFAHLFVSLQREMKKQKPMSEEKKDIEQSTDMAAEPVGAAMRADVSTLGYDIDNWPGMPLVGPSNLEEMNARIDQAEQEINEGIGFSWEQVMSDAQSIVSRYETAVY